MMLVEEGHIALDDEVHTFIPSWKDLHVYVERHPEPHRQHWRVSFIPRPRSAG